MRGNRIKVLTKEATFLNWSNIGNAIYAEVINAEGFKTSVPSSIIEQENFDAEAYSKWIEKEMRQTVGTDNPSVVQRTMFDK